MVTAGSNGMIASGESAVAGAGAAGAAWPRTGAGRTTEKASNVSDSSRTGGFLIGSLYRKRSPGDGWGDGCWRSGAAVADLFVCCAAPTQRDTLTQPAETHPPMNPISA